MERIIYLRKIIAVLAAIGGVIIGIPVVAASPASAVTSTMLSLTNAATTLGYAGVTSNVSGATVLTQDVTGKSIVWNATERGLVSANGPFTDPADNTKFNNHAIYTFSDAQAPSLCLGQSSSNVQLRSCDVNGSTWILNGSWSNGIFSGQLINLERTNAQGGAIWVLAAPGQTAGQALHVDPGSATDWRVWTFT